MQAINLTSNSLYFFSFFYIKIKIINSKNPDFCKFWPLLPNPSKSWEYFNGRFSLLNSAKLSCSSEVTLTQKYANARATSVFSSYAFWRNYKCRLRRCPESHSKFTFLSEKNVTNYFYFNMKTTTIVVCDNLTIFT